MSAVKYDLAVVGSGPSGQRAAVAASKMKKRVVVIEDVGSEIELEFTKRPGSSIFQPKCCNIPKFGVLTALWTLEKVVRHYWF